MKKVVKILPILMAVLMILMTCTPVLAAGDKDKEKDTDAATIAGVNIKIDTSEASKVSEMGNSILGIIQVIGTIIAVGVLMVLGIKYMMGSAEEKAEYKKTMLPYLIGALLLFAAVNIAGYVVDLAGAIA